MDMLDVLGTFNTEIVAFYEAGFPLRTHHSGKPEFRVKDAETLELAPRRRLFAPDIVGFVTLRALAYEPREFRPVYIFEDSLRELHGHPLRAHQLDRISEELPGRWQELAELMVAGAGAARTANHPV